MFCKLQLKAISLYTLFVGYNLLAFFIVSGQDLKVQCVNTTQCCPLEGTIWSDTLLKCVGIEGSDCSDHLSCTDNAICNSNEWKCQCEKEFSHTSNGHCLPSYGTNCTLDKSGNLLFYFIIYQVVVLYILI